MVKILDHDDTGSPLAPKWQAVATVGSSITLPPDPHIMDAIGGNHRFETAVADLVDNSIDAGARKILIRFVQVGTRVQSFYLVDNGRGMNKTQIDAAMTAGAVREYGKTELGHFGLGLKAASFSQADSLTVMSQAEDAPAVGRRWLTSKASDSFECDIIGYGFTSRELVRPWGFPLETGTVIRWDDIRAFPSSSDPDTTARFIGDATVKLQHYLGMIYHRLLADGRVSISIDVEDVTANAVGIATAVAPIDPFGYTRTGAIGYPKTIGASIDGLNFKADCHIWPSRTQQSQFRLQGDGLDHQGLFFYRNDRLLQAGGWNNLETKRRDLQLARVVIDLNDDLVTSRAFRMNPEKSKVETTHDFSAAIEVGCADDGTTFKGYLSAAHDAFKKSNRRTRTRSPIVPVGRGLAPVVRAAVERELESLPGSPEVDLRWRKLPEGLFFDIDREQNAIWINSDFRSVIAPADGRASLNDAPLVKTLLFLLVENLFHGSYAGPKHRDNLELWQALLTTAAQAERA